MKNVSIEEFYKSNKIDDNFDEKHYLQTYPETVDFYQPHCQQNNIDDKHRLYFHYMYYGPGSHKNNKFIGKISSRESCKNRKLAIITCFFNPCNYTNLKFNYLKFSEEIRKYGDLFCIELSFNQKFFTDSQNSIHIKGSENNILWQKERLLNILLDEIPTEYSNIAWIDSDIIFEDPFWHNQLYNSLLDYKIIQLFSHGYRLNKDGSKGEKFISRVKHNPYGVTGFAWAARREVLDNIKFLDNQILGGADYVMCSAFMNNPKMLINLPFYIKDKYTLNWIEHTKNIVDCSTGFLETGIVHLYHGDRKNRQYNERYEHIKEDINAFKKRDNLWFCEDKNVTNNVKNYFLSRKEDDNILKINDIFDRVYLINLEKDKDKLEIMQNKLSNLDIEYEKFVAIDGDNIDCQHIEKNFVQGVGLLENKYALGCYLSHLKVIEDAKTKNYNKILILEDDVLFCDNFLVYLQNIKKLQDWKLLYLGASQHDWSDVDYIDSFYRAKESCGAFAYGIDSSLYDDMILSFDDKYTIDNNLREIQKKYKNQCFVFYPNICIADVSLSNIRESRNQNEHNKKMKWNINGNYR